MYRLVRKNDGLVKQSEKVCFISFYKKNVKGHIAGRFKSKHKKPKVGMSLLMSPFNIFFTWQTTTIIEIIEERKDYLHFKTLNSEYELFKEDVRKPKHKTH